jgi:hypothetical protein
MGGMVDVVVQAGGAERKQLLPWSVCLALEESHVQQDATAAIR